MYRCCQFNNPIGIVFLFPQICDEASLVCGIAAPCPFADNVFLIDHRRGFMEVCPYRLQREIFVVSAAALRVGVVRVILFFSNFE